MSNPYDDLHLAIAAISQVDPEPIQVHWVDVAGVLYPPKQAYELTCGQSRSAYNSHHALTQLREIGFATSVYQLGSEPAPRKTTVARTADVELVGEKLAASFSTVSPNADEVQTPGTWRTSDGSAVPFKEACARWAIAAYAVLADTATRYNDFITYKELAEKIQAMAGIRTNSQMHYWIGTRVLGEVALECQRRREPALTALCVSRNQTVGQGYQYVLEIASEPIPDDLDQHAAVARLDCYRHFAAQLPEDGGVPTLPPQVMAARETSARRSAATVPRPSALCPGCNVALPRSGACDYCA